MEEERPFFEAKKEAMDETKKNGSKERVLPVLLNVEAALRFCFFFSAPARGRARA